MSKFLLHSAAALMSGALAVNAFAAVGSGGGSGLSHDPDVSDPRAIGHRGVLNDPTDVGTSARSNWHAVEAARDRGADRIVDDQSWELDQLREDREARRETDVLLDDRDHTLRLEAREARERQDEKEQGAAANQLRRDEVEGPMPIGGQVMDDERSMNQARRDVTRKLSELRGAENREFAEAQKKFSSASEADQLKAQVERIHEKYKALQDQAMDDYVNETDRLMGLPKIEGPLRLPDKPATRRATTAPSQAPATTTKPAQNSGSGTGAAKPQAARP